MNPWIQHVRQFANKNNISYSQALKHSDCSKTYNSKVGSGARQSRVIPVDEPPILTSEQILRDLNNRLSLLNYNRQENLNDIRRDMNEIRRLFNIGYDDTYRGIQEAQSSLNLSSIENQQIQAEINQINEIIRNLTPQSSIDEEDTIRTASTGSGLKRIKKKR